MSDGAVMDNIDNTSAAIGGVLARMDNMEKELTALKADVGSILSILNQARGGWRVILGIGAVIGAVIGLIELFLRK